MEEKKLTKKEKYDLKKIEKEKAHYKANRQKKAKRFLFWGVALIVVGVFVWWIMLKFALLRLPF